MKKYQHGFTLIELMIVMAIIGVLASVALPTYKNFTIRAQVSEGLNLSGPLQAAVAEYYNDYGSYPVNNSAAGVETPASYRGQYVIGVSISGADISIQYGNNAHAQINGQTVIITAVPNQGSLNWSCASGGAIPDELLPPICR